MKTETGEIISKKEALVREAMECGFQRFEAEAFYNCLRIGFGSPHGGSVSVVLTVWAVSQLKFSLGGASRTFRKPKKSFAANMSCDASISLQLRVTTPAS